MWLDDSVVNHAVLLDVRLATDGLASYWLTNSRVSVDQWSIVNQSVSTFGRLASKSLVVNPRSVASSHSDGGRLAPQLLSSQSVLLVDRLGVGSQCATHYY